MIDQSTVREIAARLQHAERDRVQLHQLHLQFPSMTIDDAYAIQREWIGLKLAAGQRLVGHKIGLTSKAMQTSVGIDEPDFGALLDEMLLRTATRCPSIGSLSRASR